MATQALVLGFGGTGAHILTFLKELAVLKEGRKPDSIRFLLFDTIADWNPGSTVKILGGAAEEKLAVGREEGTSLDPKNEYFFLGDRNPDLGKHVFEYLSQEGTPELYPHLKDWLHAPWLGLHVSRNRLSITEGAAQQRQIGRFAMFQNAERISQQIRQEIQRLRDFARDAAVNVWIVGSAAGGTGAGCMLDAAFLTRLAARGGGSINVTGVIVLPDIYQDKDGISPGRAYSLFRELDRFQELGFRDDDRFGHDGQMVSSRVRYDDRDRHTAYVQSRLFDNLFYVGRPCRSDGERTSFFTSVANAIDPFLDVSSGPPLLEAALNDSAAASSFGAARIYMPLETYADLFAWDEVASYLEAAAAPRVEEGLVRDLFFGAASDRERSARRKVENLLPLFKSLLERVGNKDEELRTFARGLSPQAIVKEWYGFGGATVAGMELTPAEAQLVALTYVNPYLSLSEDDPDRVAAAERITRTWAEWREAKQPKEKKPASADRFAKELEQVTSRYRNREGGDGSFEKGRRLVFARLSQLLHERVDGVILSELEQRQLFGQDPDAPDQGTVMTRLFQELRAMLADNGPFSQIDGMVSTFLDAMQGEEEVRQQEAVRALKELKEWTPAGLFGGTVQEPQEAAREAAGEYLESYQKALLLKDMQNLVRDVRKRCEQWAAAIRTCFEGLVLDAGRSAWSATGKQCRRLRTRLHRLAQNRTALISCSPERDAERPDVSMQGFRDRLREESVMPDGTTSLAMAALSSSRWRAVADRGGPQLRLALDIDGSDREYTADTICDLHSDLHAAFRKEIDSRIQARDIFDYLLYAQQAPRNVRPEEIAQMLNEAASVLINAEALEECRLVYKDPVDPAKQNLAKAISLAVEQSLGTIKVSESPHSDAHAITLLKIRKPNLASIINISDCREDYLRWQRLDLGGGEDQDQRLRRSQVFHPFRPELEAWNIERRHFKQRQEAISERDHISPRVVRLLEDPAMMQAFVHCVATGAVEKVDGSWIWHDTANDRDVTVTDGRDDPEADVVRAAVVFVLQQREGKRGGLIPISLASAERSAVDAAQARGETLTEAVAEFLEQRLDQFLGEHFTIGDDAERHRRELAGLRMVFTFYGHPETRPALRKRLDLGSR